MKGKTTMVLLLMLSMVLAVSGVSAVSELNSNGITTASSAIRMGGVFSNKATTDNDKIWLISEGSTLASSRAIVRNYMWENILTNNKDYRVSPQPRKENGIYVYVLQQKVDEKFFVRCGREKWRNFNGTKVKAYAQCQKTRTVWKDVNLI